MTLTDAQQARIAELDKQAKAEIAAMQMDNRTRQDAALKALTDSLAITDSGTTPVPDPTGNVLKEDPCTNPDPEPLWGDLTGDMASPTRHTLKTSGGPNNGPYRLLEVRDGDSMGFSGERCELGNNSRTDTFYVFNSGTRRIVETWLKLGSNWPLSSSTWQVVTQLKQCQPYSGASSSSPILSLEARSGSWKLLRHDPGETTLWSTPAQVNVWTKIVWDVTFSKDSGVGKIRMTIGSADSGVKSTRTLAYATASGGGLNNGDPIPSHIRIGAYHNASLPGTTIGVGPTRVLQP